MKKRVAFLAMVVIGFAASPLGESGHGTPTSCTVSTQGSSCTFYCHGGEEPVADAIGITATNSSGGTVIARATCDILIVDCTSLFGSCSNDSIPFNAIHNAQGTCTLQTGNPGSATCRAIPFN